MKKIFKIFAAIMLVVIALIVLIPVLFEGKIITLVKQTANNNLNATLDFEEASLSIWRNFPNTKVSLQNATLITKAPFEGDTLFSAKAIDLKMPLTDLFKSGSTINITNFSMDEGVVSIKIDSSGNANYDIALTNNTTDDDSNTNSTPLEFGLNSYEMTNSLITYNDVASKIVFKISDFNHSGSGNISADKGNLQTNSTGLISFEMNDVTYLNKNAIALDALLGMDFKESTYRFLENKAFINQLPLVFDGFVKLNENSQEVAISFQTPSSDFKNFLALIPEVYSKNIEGVTTTGNFDVKGKFEGIVDENHIPKFDISIHSDNASFKYPNLPKSLTNIIINTEISNKTGLTKDTYVLIDNLTFAIDNEVFNASAKLLEITENMKVTASLKGIVNLESLEDIYPAEALKGLKGILDVDATTNFDMRSIENKQYQNTKTAGNLKVSNFQYNSEELTNTLQVKNAGLKFSPNKVNLTNFDAQLGKTDFVANGAIDNLLGFLFSKENIEGNFTINSNTFSVNDFMVTEDMVDANSISQPSGKQVKIPSFLDCTLNATAATVLYDNITLKNVSGTLLIKDQTAELKNIKSTVFKGVLGLNGSVSTKEDVSKFKMNLAIQQFDIAQSFKGLELFQALAPIAKIINGKINSTINLSGDLNTDFTPNLKTLSGSMLAELLSSKVSTDTSPLLQKLEQELPFLEAEKWNLQNLKTALNFKDGKVVLDPFTLNYQDIEIAVTGGHGFDTSLAYDAVIKVPAKYLGKEAEKLIAQLKDAEVQSITVPVSALITGKFNNPTIKTDFKSAITNLGKEVAASQKDKLINEGKEKVTDALKDLLNKKSKDSVKTDSSQAVKKEAAKDLLKDLLNRNKKKKDTAN